LLGFVPAAIISNVGVPPIAAPLLLLTVSLKEPIPPVIDH